MKRIAFGILVLLLSIMVLASGCISNQIPEPR